MRALRRDRLTQFLALGCLGLAAFVVAGAWARPVAPTLIQPGIGVSIEGEVAQPGAYELAFGARVSDLVDVAGGMLPAAARSLVRLAAPLTDGQVVVVPSLSVEGHAPRVSLNSASLGQLEALPGVGPATARRIVEHRPYSRVNDLLRVPGIGPKKLERLRQVVSL